MPQEQRNAYYVKLGRRLNQARKFLGLKQAECAAVLDVGRTVYARYESGEIHISAEDIAKLAEFFDVPLSQLMGEAVDVDLSKVDYRDVIRHQFRTEGELADELVAVTEAVLNTRRKRRVARERRERGQE